MAITRDPPRVWRIEGFRDASQPNAMTVHVERLIKEDGTRIASQRDDEPADAGTPVGDPTVPANYTDSDGGVPRKVTRTFSDIMNLPNTLDVGSFTGITTAEAVQIFGALADLLVDLDIEARRVAAVAAAVEAAS